jgi:hypothetical protein
MSYAASLGLTSTAGFATLAYRTIFTDAASLAMRNMYIGAATGAFSLMPNTRLSMWDNVMELKSRAEAASSEVVKGDRHALVRSWGKLNVIRGCMLLSAGIGFCACVI